MQAYDIFYIIVRTVHLGTLGPVLNERIQVMHVLLKVVLAEDKRGEASNIYLNARHSSAIIGIRIHLEDRIEHINVAVKLVNLESILGIYRASKRLHYNINRAIIVVDCIESIIILLAAIGLLEANDKRVGHLF
jgi:hypothetical protein